MKSAHEIHNEVAPEVIKLLVEKVMANGGTFADMWVILESVVVGVCAIAVKPGGEAKMLDGMIEACKKRLAKGKGETQ